MTTDTEIAEVAHTVKKRGSKSASVELNCSASKAEIGLMMRNIIKWTKLPKVTGDKEVFDRLCYFFDEVSKTGEMATVEKMCLALGTNRTTLWEWENGSLGAERANMIKSAKEVLATMDAEMANSGKIPQVVYIFRSKNYYGMRDQQEFVLTPNAENDAAAGDVQSKYKQIATAQIKKGAL